MIVNTAMMWAQMLHSLPMVAQSDIGYSRLSLRLLPTSRVVPHLHRIPQAQRSLPERSRISAGTASEGFIGVGPSEDRNIKHTFLPRMILFPVSFVTSMITTGSVLGWEKLCNPRLPSSVSVCFHEVEFGRPTQMDTASCRYHRPMVVRWCMKASNLPIESRMANRMQGKTRSQK